MLGKTATFLRGLRSAWKGTSKAWQQRDTGSAKWNRPGTRYMAAAAGAAGSIAQLLVRMPGAKARTAVLLGGSAFAWNSIQQEQQFDWNTDAGSLPWVQHLAAQEGLQEVLVPGQALRKHPGGRLLSKEDHLFGTMQRSDQIREFRCFYDAPGRKFHSVVLLGSEVCGYPATVHGGLTAAIVDETFGGLYTSLLTSGKLGVTLPGLTARLEMNYAKKIPAGTALLVTAEVESVEPGKVWMRASVSNGEGTTYASGRALFVAPNIGRQFARMLGLGPRADQGAAAAKARAQEQAAAQQQG